MNNPVVSTIGANYTLPSVDDKALRQSFQDISTTCAKVAAAFAGLQYLPTISHRAEALIVNVNECEKFRRTTAVLIANVHSTAGTLAKLGSGSGVQAAEAASEIAEALDSLGESFTQQVSKLDGGLASMASTIPAVTQADAELKTVQAALNDKIDALQARVKSEEDELKTLDTSMAIMSQLDIKEMSKSFLDHLEQSAELAKSLTGEAAVDPAKTIATVKDMLGKKIAVIDGNLKYMDLLAAQTSAREQLDDDRAELAQHREDQRKLTGRLDYLQLAVDLEGYRAAYHSAFSGVIAAYKQFMAQLRLDQDLGRLKLLSEHFIAWATPLSKA